MISIRRARGRAGRPRGSDLDVIMSTVYVHVAIASWCVCLTRSKALEYSDAAAALFVASHDLEKTNVFTTGPGTAQLARHEPTCDRKG